MKKFAFAALLALGVVALLAPPTAFAADEDKMFKLHGEIRFRGEYTNNTYNFNDDDDPIDDDSTGFWPYRVRIAAEGQFSDNVSGWIEFQNTGVFGEQGLIPIGDQTNARRFNDGKSLTQMYQAYINLGKLWSDNFNVRFGRQEMLFGNEFIFGDEDFYTGISHDAIVATWDLKAVDISAWYARTLEGSVFQYGFPGGAQDVPPDLVAITPDANNIEHLGAYVTFGVGKDKSQDVDVYFVNMNLRGTGGRFQTLGARYGRDGWDKGGLVWNVEYAIQMGDFSSELVGGFDESAGGSAGEALIGWNFKAPRTCTACSASTSWRVVTMTRRPMSSRASCRSSARSTTVPVMATGSACSTTPQISAPPASTAAVSRRGPWATPACSAASTKSAPSTGTTRMKRTPSTPSAPTPGPTSARRSTSGTGTTTRRT